VISRPASIEAHQIYLRAALHFTVEQVGAAASMYDAGANSRSHLGDAVARLPSTSCPVRHAARDTGAMVAPRVVAGPARFGQSVSQPDTYKERR
jgi:hypothetical protein